VGYELREFSNQAEAPAGLVAGLSLTHRLNERTTTQLSYTRQTVVSVEYNGQSYVVDTANLRLTRILGASGKWTANVAGGAGLYAYAGNVFANRQDFLYTAGLGLTYAIQEWMKAGLSYDFTKFESNYPGAIGYDVHRVMLQFTVGY
jgi:opacity protein-like surface antigen